MGRVLGIDLGTTNSCVAVLESGTPLVVPVDQTRYMLPSVVAFKEDGKVLVGRLAKRQSVVNAQHTITAAKRMMGLAFDDARTQRAMQHAGFACERGPTGDVRVRVPGRSLSLPEVSAYILGELKRATEEHFGEKLSQAVITVPAYFNDFQRQATKDAGKIAGLEVLRILNEPTAAALAYGALQQGKQRHVVVYDLGGGTFDVSVLRLETGLVEVLATAGDAFLGGRDFDQRVVEWILARIEGEHGTSLKEDRNALQRLWEAAEAGKIDLSDHLRTRFAMPFVGQKPSGEPLHLDYELDRDTYERLVADLVERTIVLFSETIQKAKLDPQRIDEVILVGGMTRMPLIAQRVEALVGKSPSSGVHPDLVVAVGAAIQGGLLSQDKPGTILLDVTPHNLGIMSLGGLAETVIPKDTAIPTTANKTFTTAQDDQETVRIVVYQGDSRRILDNQILGEFSLTGIRKAPRGTVQIEVSFMISADGIVSVAAKDLDTGRAQTIEIKERHTLPEAELMRMVASHQDELLAALNPHEERTVISPPPRR